MSTKIINTDGNQGDLRWRPCVVGVQKHISQRGHLKVGLLFIATSPMHTSATVTRPKALTRALLASVCNQKHSFGLPTETN